MAHNLHTDAVPGTVHLIDLDHTMATRHAGKGDIVLVPTPSNDPEDPLNWDPRRKLMSTVCVNVYVLFRRPLFDAALKVDRRRVSPDTPCLSVWQTRSSTRSWCLYPWLLGSRLVLSIKELDTSSFFAAGASSSGSHSRCNTENE